MEQSELAGMRDDYESLFEDTAVGNLIVTPDAFVQRANKRFATWIGSNAAELEGLRLLNFLTVGGKIYLETHLLPTLRMHGEFEEVMLEMKKLDGSKLPVLVNACERRDAEGRPLFLMFTVVRAAGRLTYEQNLREATKQTKTALASAEGTLLDERQTAVLREQFVAVLGHDLRNPLAAIDAAMRTLGRTPLDERQCSRWRFRRRRRADRSLCGHPD
jgi:sigma-B regulation protein RsbU (phosphoserine phosphatase)